MSDQSQSPKLPYFIGCPVWNCDRWADQVYPRKTARREWLSWYTRMFNTVEGNSTFYAIPPLSSVRRWAVEAKAGFKFCLKMPRLISHELQLQNTQAALDEFLEVLDVLKDAERLGPTFLQLGPEFGPERMNSLAKFCEQLPDQFEWAVEVRHLKWFDQATHENELNEMLREQSIDRVLFDSRALFQREPEDDIERESQRRKPRSPVRQTVTGDRPFLRFVGRNQVDLAKPYIEQWAKIVAGWVGDGKQPYVFLHAPDDAYAPRFARIFHQALQRHLRVPAADLPELSQPPKQLDLLLE